MSLNRFCSFDEIKKQAEQELENIRKNKKPDGLTNKQLKISGKERLKLTSAFAE